MIMVKKGKAKGTKMTKTPVYANLDHAILIADLAYIAARLPRRDNVLAGMLIKWFDIRGSLSEKQEALGRAILLRNEELLNA
jgi:hypothetical protein